MLKKTCFVGFQRYYFPFSLKWLKVSSLWNFTMYPVVLFGVFMTCLLAVIRAQYAGIVKEYCMETFRPVCTAGSVIIMSEARYGRMRIGRCMTVNNAPCVRDELSTLDKLCSGRWNCELIIPSPQMTSQLNCLADLTPYLEAGYTCQKVVKPQHSQCISPEKVKVVKKPGYIASVTSSSTSCGLHGSPWILEAEPGQTVSLSLTDFNWKPDPSAECTVKYGYVLDMKNDDVISICGGGERQRDLYQSSGHGVQIVLEEAVVKRFHFILKFSARGCPQYTPPPHGWIQPENNSLLIGCNNSPDTWRLKCVDNIWLGIVGNCPPPSPSSSSRPQEEAILISAVKDTDDSSGQLPAVSGNHVVAFAMGCVTLIVCCSVAMLGIYCTKRYEARQLKVKGNVTSHPLFGNQTLRSSTLYKAVTSRGSVPSATVELPPYTSPLPRENRPPKVPKRNSSMTDAMLTSTTSDYLEPHNDTNTDEVQYYILENPAELLGNMSEEMYQSIHLHNSLGSNK